MLMQDIKSLNFEPLRPNYPELANMGGYAEHYAWTDAESALVKLRNFAERMVDVIYLRLRLPQAPQSTFSDLLRNDSFRMVADPLVQDKLHLLRRLGNRAAHGEGIAVSDALRCVQEAWQLARWLHVSQLQGKMSDFTDFAEPPQGGIDSKAEIRRVARKLEEDNAIKEARIREMLEEMQALREQEQALRAQINASNQPIPAAQLEALSNAALAATKQLQFSEDNTRKWLIDRDLRMAGWAVGHNGANTPQVGQEVEVLHQGTQTGLGYADYVLWDDNGKPLAVVEAKKAIVSATQGQQQAKDYADGLEKMHGQRPMIFYTNGHDIWLWDDAGGYPPRKLYGFFSKDTLQYRIGFQRREQRDLLTLTPDPVIAGRLYQIETLRRVQERFAARHRKALVVQATGTGKTRVATRLCQNLFGAGLHKTEFLIFDHWANFAYHEMNADEVEPATPKPLTQRRFEARLELARLALKRSELDAFASLTALLKQDADALEDGSIAIRDNWQAVQLARDAAALDQFAPATVQVLTDNVAPLLNALDVRGQGDALRWDLLLAKAQEAALTKPGQENPLKHEILALLDRLPANLSQVRTKHLQLKEIRSDAFWQAADFARLEAQRIALRDIIHLAEPLTLPTPLPPGVLDVKEDEAEYRVEAIHSKVKSIDARIYQQKVEATLRPLFGSNPVLTKIRNGEPVSEAELEQLNSLIHTHNPDVDLHTLAEFYADTAVPLAQILRSLVGMDGAAVEARFTAFAQKHPLTSSQLRFLDILKEHIALAGAIHLGQLFEPPFTRIHHDGITGVFSLDGQLDELIGIVRSFGEPPAASTGQPTPSP